MKVFLGLLYLAGTHKAGRLNLTLKHRWLWGGNISSYSEHQKISIFIYKCIQFDDRDKKRLEKLAPIRKLFEDFLLNYQSSYSVGAYIIIDEELEAIRGRCTFVQYIPSEPAKLI